MSCWISPGWHIGVFLVTTTTAAVFVLESVGRIVLLSLFDGIIKNSVVMSKRDCVRDLKREFFTISLFRSSDDASVMRVKRISCHFGPS